MALCLQAGLILSPWVLWWKLKVRKVRLNVARKIIFVRLIIKAPLIILDTPLGIFSFDTRKLAIITVIKPTVQMLMYRSTVLATKWLRILSIGGIDKTRSHLVANPICAQLLTFGRNILLSNSEFPRFIYNIWEHFIVSGLILIN